MSFQHNHTTLCDCFGNLVHPKTHRSSFETRTVVKGMPGNFNDALAFRSQASKAITLNHEKGAKVKA